MEWVTIILIVILVITLAVGCIFMYYYYGRAGNSYDGICTRQSECPSGYVCMGGVCKRGVGETCSGDGVCVDGSSCVEGICSAGSSNREIITKSLSAGSGQTTETQPSSTQKVALTSIPAPTPTPLPLKQTGTIVAPPTLLTMPIKPREGEIYIPEETSEIPSDATGNSRSIDIRSEISDTESISSAFVDGIEGSRRAVTLGNGGRKGMMTRTTPHTLIPVSKHLQQRRAIDEDNESDSDQGEDQQEEIDEKEEDEEEGEEEEEREGETTRDTKRGVGLGGECTSKENVLDVCGYSSDIIILYKDGHIMLETEDKKRTRITNNIRLDRVENFGGYVYGVSCGSLYKLDSSTYGERGARGGEWIWDSCRWSPVGITHISATLGGDHLWIQTQNVGNLYNSEGEIVPTEISPRDTTSPREISLDSPWSKNRRVYGLNKNIYMDINTDECQAILRRNEEDRGVLIRDIYAGAINYDGQVASIRPEQKNRFRDIRIINWKAYYLLKGNEE